MELVKMFEKGPEGEKEMLEFLTSVENQTEWILAQTKTFKAVEMKGGPLGVPEEVEKYGIAPELENKAFEEAMDGSNMYLSVAGEYKILTQTGKSTTAEMTGRYSRSFNELPASIQADDINIGVQYLKDKTVLILERMGKIRCVHGQSYAIVNQAELFKKVTDVVTGILPKTTFDGGMFTHDRTDILYSFTGHKNEILKSYIDSCKSMGFSDSEKLEPAAMLRTSDTSYSKVSIMPIVKQGRYYIPLGSPIDMKHNRDASPDVFAEKAKTILATFQDTVERLTALHDIIIDHPVNCFIGVALNFNRVPKTMVRDIAEVFSARLPKNRNATAHDVFMHLQRIAFKMNEKNEGSADELSEDFARLLIDSSMFKRKDTFVTPIY